MASLANSAKSVPKKLGEFARTNRPTTKNKNYFDPLGLFIHFHRRNGIGELCRRQSLVNAQIQDCRSRSSRTYRPKPKAENISNPQDCLLIFKGPAAWMGWGPTPPARTGQNGPIHFGRAPGFTNATQAKHAAMRGVVQAAIPPGDARRPRRRRPRSSTSLDPARSRPTLLVLDALP